MNALTNLSVLRRMTLGFFLILLMTLLAIGVGLDRLARVAQETQAITGVQIQTERIMADWYRNTIASVQRATASGRSSDPSLLVYFSEAQAQATRLNTELQKKIGEMALSDQDKAVLADILELRKNYNALRDNVVGLKKEGKTQAPKATPNCSTYGHPNCSRQDAQIMGFEVGAWAGFLG